MNCDDFLARMHDCIDECLPLDSETQLQDHVRQCDSCRAQWNAWTQISEVLDVQSEVSDHQPRVLSNKHLLFRTPKTSHVSLGHLAPRSTIRAPRSIIRVAGGFVVAAAVMFVMILPRTEPSNQPNGPQPSLSDSSSPLDSSSPSSSMTAAASTVTIATSANDSSIHSTVDAAQWWQDVQQRDWVAQTMPTVRSVREGVAPLGRSILQAVSILTIGSGERTS
tara:strand:- start:78294 stop:78959 length:666 start_codon:yes stop_codon:yes gene_type:complete